MPTPNRPTPKEFRDCAELMTRWAADAKRIAVAMEEAGIAQLTVGKVGSSAVTSTAKKLAGWLSAANASLLACTIEKIRKNESESEKPAKTRKLEAAAVRALAKNPSD